MFKKMLLTVLFCASNIATAQLSLNLDIVITNQDITRSLQGTVLVDENVPASVEFANELVLTLLTQVDGDVANIETQIFQKTENDELLTTTTMLTVQVPLGETGTITVTEADGSLLLAITPTLVE